MMNRNRRRLAIASAQLVWGLAGGLANAGGFALYEQSASGLGTSYAGAGTVAEDASTIFWNPAGMARLAPGKHLALSAISINPSTSFSNGASAAGLNRTDFGGNGGNFGSSAILPNGYFAMDINREWNFGVGINSPFGLSTAYDPSWVGRFQGIRSEIKTVNINPSLSWKANDQLAVGFGVSYQEGKVNLLSGTNYKGVVLGTALNPLVPVNAEGQATTAVNGSGWGYNFGMIYDLNPATRLGFAYRSTIKQNLSGNVNFTGVPAAFAASAALTAATANGNVNLSIKTPDSATFSVLHKLNDRWDLMGDITWTGWSVIKSLPLVRDTGATLDTLTFNFRDTMRYSGGARYRMNDAWMLKMGVAYDQTPVPDAASMSVRLPDSDRTWLSFGAKYKVSNAGAIDLGYSYIRAKNTAIANNQNITNVRGNIDGTYSGSVNIFGVQYSHAF
jgi:long-chain fatty acid transport protein